MMSEEHNIDVYLNHDLEMTIYTVMTTDYAYLHREVSL